jgi:LysM repeat protein
MLKKTWFAAASALALLSALGSASPAFGQTQLLLNPGFEEPFVNQGGDPARFVAQNWTAWHVPATSSMSLSENIQPEYYPATDVENGLSIPRIRSGQNAQQYFSFFATHTGGVYQQVSGVTAGTEYRFGIYAYLWSSSFDDVDVSEQDGGIILQVGIDPNGGTDGQSSAIVWSAPVALQYDSYDLYEVTAPAGASTITVFVRSTVSFPVKNNYIYLDDASLGLAEGEVVVPPITATPPPTATGAPTNTTPSTATTAPTATGAATNTTAPTATGAPTNTTAPTATGAPTNTTAPTATGAPTNTTAPTATGAATNTTAPTATGAATNTTPSTATTAPTATGAATNTTPSTATAAPLQSPTPTPTVDSTRFPASIMYTVERGDSVSRLAQLFGSDVQAIISANGLAPSGLIFVDQRLIIPVPLVSMPPVAATATRAPATATASSVTAVPATPVPTAGPTAAPDGTLTITVQPGDSLGVIAARYRTTTTVLAQLNGILNPNIIFVGQRLRVPAPGTTPPIAQPGSQPVATAITLPNAGPVTPLPPSPVLQTYRVRFGDSLYKIALQFDVTLADLIQFNGITNPNRIYPGQLLVIPRAAR